MCKLDSQKETVCYKKYLERKQRLYCLLKCLNAYQFGIFEEMVVEQQVLLTYARTHERTHARTHTHCFFPVLTCALVFQSNQVAILFCHRL